MCSRKLFIFCLVLVLASVQVFAWPTKEKPQPVEQPQIQEVEETSQEPSATMPSDVLTRFNETSTSLENKVVVLGSDLTTLRGDMTDLASAVSMLVANNNDLQKSLDLALEENKKATGTKYLADVGIAFGFKNETVKLGMTGSMGLRIGPSFLTKVGVQYMCFDMGDFKMPQWNMEDMTISATVGWEF